MKKLAVLFFVFQTLTSIAWANPFDGEYLQALEVKELHEAEIMSVEKVRGVAVSYCDKDTGEVISATPTNPDNFIPCILVMAQDQDAVRALEEKYGMSPTQLDSVMMVYMITGDVGPQPGGTVGNGRH